MSDECSVLGCHRPVKARGWCTAHYSRWQRHGDPRGGLDAPAPVRVCVTEGCDELATLRGFCSPHLAELRNSFPHPSNSHRATSGPGRKGPNSGV
jgi:hypothetical protein